MQSVPFTEPSTSLQVYGPGKRQDLAGQMASIDHRAHFTRKIMLSFFFFFHVFPRNPLQTLPTSVMNITLSDDSVTRCKISYLDKHFLCVFFLTQTHIHVSSA